MESEGLWKSITRMSNTSTAEPGIFPEGQTWEMNEEMLQAVGQVSPHITT